MTIAITYSLCCRDCGRTLPRAEETAVDFGLEFIGDQTGEIEDWVKGGRREPKPYGADLVDECPFCGSSNAPEFEYELQEGWVDVNTDVSAETDPETELPASLLFGDKTLTVTAVLSVRQDHPRAVGFTSHGGAGLIRYVLEVESGKCLVESRPKTTSDGSEGGGTNRWVMLGVSSVELYRTLFKRRGPVEEQEPEGHEKQPWPKPRQLSNMKAFRLIYKLEIECRFFVYRLLRSAFAGKFGKEWWKNDRFWSNQAELSGIDEVKYCFDKAKKLRENERALPYLQGEPEQHIFTYFLFSELTEILQVFNVLFLNKLDSQRAGMKNVVLGALRTIEGFRNMVAHNRVLYPKKLQMFEGNVNTILRAINSFPSDV